MLDTHQTTRVHGLSTSVRPFLQLQGVGVGYMCMYPVPDTHQTTRVHGLSTSVRRPPLQLQGVGTTWP